MQREQTTRRPRLARRPAMARGLTLLEVVLAVAALGLVATSATMTMSYLYGSQVRDQRRLAATELAHRLVLIRLDNPKDLPAPSEQIPYANDLYRYELETAPVALEPREHVVRALADRRNESPVTIDRLEQITARVWLSEDSGGARSFDSSIPSAVIVRLFDPHYLNRNPDTGWKTFNDEERFGEAVQRILGGR